MLSRISGLLFCFLLVLSCGNLTESQRESILQQLDEAQFSGTFLLSQKGEIILDEQRGMAEMQGQVPFQKNTSSNLGPLSEAITAAAILLLVEEGKVALEDPVQKHIPSFPYPNILVQHLLSHQTGLPAFEPYALQYWDTTKTYSPAMLLDLFETMKPALEFEPGTQTLINPVDYVMLAGIIDIYSNTFINEYLPYRLFQPLHMGNSHVYHRLIWDRPSTAARGYGDKKQSKIWEQNWKDGLYGHANYYSSVKDWNTFLQALEKEKGLLYGQADNILKAGGGDPVFTNGFWTDGKSYWRFGEHHGYSGGTYRNPSQDLTLIWLSNNNMDNPGKFTEEILRKIGVSF